MKLNKTLSFFVFLFLLSAPAKGQAVFSSEFEPDFVSYEKIEETKYQPKYLLSLKTKDYFTSISLDYRKRVTSESELTDTYYTLKGGTTIGSYGFRGKILRADNENISDFTLLQIEPFKKSSEDFNIYPVYEYRHYDQYEKSLNNLGFIVTRKSGLVFSKATFMYEFETNSITPMVSHTLQFTPRHSFKLTAASDNYYFALDPFGDADFYSPLDEKYVTGSWNSKIGEGFLELGVEGGYFDQPLYGDSYFVGVNVHFNFVSK